MNVVTAIWLIAMWLGAYWTIFKVFPACAASHFRYRVWAMRDELTSEVLDDVYSDRTLACRVIRDMEAAISVAPDFTLFRLGLFRLARRGGIPRVEPLRFDSLPVHEAARLSEWHSKLERALLRHLFAGGPSGVF